MGHDHLIETKTTAVCDDRVVMHDVEAGVKHAMARCAASHSVEHVRRVAKLAVRLAHSDDASPAVVRRTHLLALCHDLEDHKLRGHIELADGDIRSFLESRGVDHAEAVHVADLVAWVSYSHEKAHAEETTTRRTMFPELMYVQDADRLDALGATGVARMFLYGGEVGTGPTVAAVARHIDDKLVRLVDHIYSIEGRRIATARHRVLVMFRNTLAAELDGVHN